MKKELTCELFAPRTNLTDEGIKKCDEVIKCLEGYTAAEAREVFIHAANTVAEKSIVEIPSKVTTDRMEKLPIDPIIPTVTNENISSGPYDEGKTNVNTPG